MDVRQAERRAKGREVIPHSIAKRELYSITKTLIPEFSTSLLFLFGLIFGFRVVSAKAGCISAGTQRCKTFENWGPSSREGKRDLEIK